MDKSLFVRIIGFRATVIHRDTLMLDRWLWLSQRLPKTRNAICFENREHIIDDRKLLKDIAACLKPGGRLLLTTPYLLYRPMSQRGDIGPFILDV